jgi:hypothetical protein
MKKEKSMQSSPCKLRNTENKINQPEINKPQQKFNRLLHPSPSNPGDLLQEPEKRKTQLRQMQTLALNRQFAYLSEIKNQKMVRRPYAEVKQVIVTGDELNYYTNKNTIVDCALGGYTTKNTFFMQRALKSEKCAKKKSNVNAPNATN